MRNKPMMTQRGDIVPQAGSTTTTKPFDLTNIIHHNCSTIGDVEDYLLPLTMSYVAGTATHSVTPFFLTVRPCRLSLTSKSSNHQLRQLEAQEAALWGRMATRQWVKVQPHQTQSSRS